METRASYMIVGVFTLLTVAGALLFVLWTAKTSKSDMRTYEIEFNQSVSGLSTSSSVLLEGVKVGQVARIKVSPKEPGTVIVHVQVHADAPIRENSFATLEPQGVTGMSAIAVSGGTADSPMLADNASALPRIPSKPSRLQEIMNSVPSIMATLDSILERANKVLDQKNVEVAGNLLVSVAEIADTLAKNKEHIAKGVESFGAAGQSFAVAGKRFERLMASAQSVVEKDMRGAVKSVDGAAAKFEELVTTIEPGMSRFSRDSVDELHRLLVEARRLTTALARLTQKLESDPRRFLLGNPVPEFSAP
ncbi:MAG: hypothetical protein DELT_02765 [Desulfovibrio sp.]